MKFLQGNLQRSKLSQTLLRWWIFLRDPDILVLSEQYENWNYPGWYSDISNTAAIWVRARKGTHIVKSGQGDGYVWVTTTKGITYVSCYLSPNDKISIFRKKLANLEETIQGLDGEAIIAGDFNAKSIEWGMKKGNNRGAELLDMAARLDLTVMNRGKKTTFRRTGCQGSIIDLTFATLGLISKIKNWRVEEGFTASDHQFISFFIKEETPLSEKHTTRYEKTTWVVSKLNKEALIVSVSSSKDLLSERKILTNQASREEAEKLVEDTINLLVKGCKASMPPRLRRFNRQPVYWWNADIAKLRYECLKCRRKSQRAYKKHALELQEKALAYKTAKKKLGQAIKNSKRLCWRKLCDEVDNDIWGRGYQIVTNKISGHSSVGTIDPETMKDIVDTLFPQNKIRPHETYPDDIEIPLFTTSELRTALDTFNGRKAPGPDGIPMEAIKVVAQIYPHLLLNMFNCCLRAGVFSKRWKTQRLVLIDKGKGPPITASSYRPLCMLDNIGKIFEKMIRARLRTAVESAGGLSANQYGFRPGFSTLDAISKVVEISKNAWTGNHRTRDACVLVLLDVKNAFNSVRWEDIMESLRSRFGVPLYIQRIIGDYLRNRVLLYDTAKGQRKRSVTSGVAQGSVLGPDLWNIVYDDVVSTPMPEKIKVVGYADDLVAIIEARNAMEASKRVAQMNWRIDDRLRAHGLELAPQKTEIVILTRQRTFPERFVTDVNGVQVSAVTSAKYLGIRLDQKLTFGTHIRETADKAAKTVGMLSRIMPNVSGARTSRRRVLMSIVNSIALYGAEVWAKALETKAYRRRLSSVQRRSALRITCAYRTVSEAAVLVVAGVIPIDLLAAERQRVFYRRSEGPTDIIKKEERRNSLQEWQNRWDIAPEGRWTRRLIPEIKLWIGRHHGEVNFYLTQFLTGHGMFREYLHKYGRKSSSNCDYCPGEKDDVHHTFFQCERWKSQKDKLEQEVESEITPENVIGLMNRSEQHWSRISNYVETVLRIKKAEEFIHT